MLVNGKGGGGQGADLGVDDERFDELVDEGFEARASGVYASQHERRVELPPCALETEQAVLALAMVGMTYAARTVGALTPDHFASGQHQHIFRAVSALVEEGYSPQTPQVLDRLRLAGRLEEVGHDYLWRVVQYRSVDFSLDEAFAQLDDLLRRRRFIRAAQEAAAHGYCDDERIEILLDRLQKEIVELSSSSFRSALPVIEGPALAVSRSEPVWLVPALSLAPGPPIMFAGYGYSRKTLAVQAMALSVAAGKPVWGVYTTRQGAVLHIDYEQGVDLTVGRYQRLARAMGVDLTSVPLAAACLPELHLDAPGAETTLTRACAGKALVIVDSFRAACPTADENSSEVRQHLDMLNRISGRTGATFIVIHHAKKPAKEDTKGSRFSIRGSGALFDACSSVFVFAGEKGEPTLVLHHKERNRGHEVENFGLDAIDVDEPGVANNPMWGLCVVHLEGEQLASNDDSKSSPERFTRAQEQVLGVVVKNPGVGKRSIREMVGGRKDLIDASLDNLLRTGRIEDRGHTRNSRFHAV